MILPFDFKLAWPTDYSHVNQPFGANYQYYHTHFGLPGHEGIDIEAPYGSAIYACAEGTVKTVFNSPTYGLNIRIVHNYGFETIYAHLAQALVKPGEKVYVRHLIGKADSTGNSTGSHLHLTLKKYGATAAGITKFPNDIIDPTPYLLPPPITQKARVMNNLHLRGGPGTNFPTYVIMPAQSLVVVLESSGTWWKIRYGTTTGWAHSDYMVRLQ